MTSEAADLSAPEMDRARQRLRRTGLAIAAGSLLLAGSIVAIPVPPREIDRVPVAKPTVFVPHSGAAEGAWPDAPFAVAKERMPARSPRSRDRPRDPGLLVLAVGLLIAGVLGVVVAAGSPGTPKRSPQLGPRPISLSAARPSRP